MLEGGKPGYRTTLSSSYVCGGHVIAMYSETVLHWDTCVCVGRVMSVLHVPVLWVLPHCIYMYIHLNTSPYDAKFLRRIIFAVFADLPQNRKS